MNKLKFEKFDLILFFCVFFVFIASLITLQTQELSEKSFIQMLWHKQTLIFIVSLICMLIFSSINYNVIVSYGVHLYLFSIFLLIVTFLIGKEVNGARSWLVLGPVSFQTSELTKFATILVLAKYLSVSGFSSRQIQTFVVAGSITLLPIALTLIQPDFGASFFFFPVLFIMLFALGADLYHLGAIFFFSLITLGIPLYVAYYHITLVPNLKNYLIGLEQSNLLAAVNILDTQIWDFAKNGSIPANVDGSDKTYLLDLFSNPELFRQLQEIINTISYEGGTFLLVLFKNQTFLIVFGLILVFMTSILFVIRFARGTAFIWFRKIYIPLGVLGISFFCAGMMQKFIPFKYHQAARITAFINPAKFPRDLAYQIRVSKVAIGSGQFLGRGLDAAEMTIGKIPIVPESHNDFIFSSWAERTGFVGSFLLLLVLTVIPIRVLIIALQANTLLASLVGVGISAWFLYNIFFNIGVTLGILPVTGLPLSFMSQGGSHFLMQMIGIGVIMNIYSRRFTN